METTKIVDMIMKDHLADASDAVKDVIMNKAAEILTLEKEKVGSNMFGHLYDQEEEEVETDSPDVVDSEEQLPPSPEDNETNN